MVISDRKMPQVVKVGGLGIVAAGDRPGQTTIAFQYFAIPAVSNEAGTAHDGTTLPTTPTEKFVFGRRAGGK